MANEPIHGASHESRSRPTIWGAPVAVAITFLLVGCYTILKHPITSEEGNIQVSHQEYYRDRCLDCHEDYSEYPYGFFYEKYPDYYFEYPRWGYFYAYPWWWDHLWYENETATSAGPGGIESTPSGKASRRGWLLPPYVQGRSAVPAPGGGHSTGGGGVSAPSEDLPPAATTGQEPRGGVSAGIKGSTGSGTDKTEQASGSHKTQAKQNVSSQSTPTDPVKQAAPTSTKKKQSPTSPPATKKQKKTKGDGGTTL